MSYQALMEKLLEQTGASRTTLRIDDRPGEVFPVKAEALAPGISSIAGDATIPIRQSATFKWVDRHRRILVQPDLLSADPAPAAALIERYGARAQMLAPVELDGKLVGLVSVHYTPGPREWTESDIAALGEILAQVRRELAAP